jgi:hypothetical protein
MTCDPTDWHQALARVSAAEEEARTLEAENNTLASLESLKKRFAA